MLKGEFAAKILNSTFIHQNITGLRISRVPARFEAARIKGTRRETRKNIEKATRHRRRENKIVVAAREGKHYCDSL